MTNPLYELQCEIEFYYKDYSKGQQPQVWIKYKYISPISNKEIIIEQMFYTDPPERFFNTNFDFMVFDERNIKQLVENWIADALRKEVGDMDFVDPELKAKVIEYINSKKYSYLYHLDLSAPRQDGE